jgi:hypothetical protein
LSLVCVGVEVSNEEGGETQSADNYEKPLRNDVDLPQHIGLDVFRRIDETVDGSNLGEISSGDDNSDSTSLSDKGCCGVSIADATKKNCL